MPYIKQSMRPDIREFTDRPGELNFLLTKVCKCYLEYNGLSYDTINDIIGALECAKQEFYRRIATPYEDSKIKENGDVY